MYMHEIQLVQQFDGGNAITMTDIPTPVGVRAIATAGNTSIRVSWEWQGVPMCVDLVRVDYQPEGGSLMNYTVGSTTTSATLPNLQCNTKYTVWVYASDRKNKTRVFIPARGTYIYPLPSMHVMYTYSLLYILLHVPSQPLPLPLTTLLSSQVPQLSG